MEKTVLVIVSVHMLIMTAHPADLQPNILMITVDALRPDHLGCYGYDRNLTPTLDSLASTGALFRNAFSSAAWTSPGLISLLTGRHEPAHGVMTREKNLTSATPTLPGELARHGYTAPDICYLIGAPNYQNLQFHDFPQKQEFLTAGHDIIFRWLHEFASSSEPFFLYYHYRDLHQPYDPPPPYDTMFLPGAEPPTDPGALDRFETVRRSLLLPPGSISFSPADTGWVRGLYDGEVAQFDAGFLAPLLETLTDLGINDRTAIIITADHGEELLDHGAVGHASTSLTSSLYDECLRIPLIVSMPGVVHEGIRCDGLVQNVDVMPTVLDLLGLSVPTGVQGRSLIESLRGGTLEDRPVFISSVLGGYQATKEMQEIHLRSVRTRQWKLVRRDTERHGASRWLYRLTTDPSELHDLSLEFGSVADSLEAELSNWLAASRALYREPIWDSPRQRKPPSIPEIIFPGNGDTLDFVATSGRLGVTLSPNSSGPIRIEYDVGTGPYHVEGNLDSAPDGVSYGPFSPTFWKTLVRYNPWSFRVVPLGHPELSSHWITFYLQPDPKP